MFTLLLAQGGEFAFVVFQAAGPNVLPPGVASFLIGAVALSMLLSPLLLVAIDKLGAAALERARHARRWRRSRSRRTPRS